VFTLSILVLYVIAYGCIRQRKNDDLYFSILRKIFTSSVRENLTSIDEKLNTFKQKNLYTHEILFINRYPANVEYRVSS
jgi:hypothetical protein